MRISVFGLGYVGAVSAVCLVRDGHHVIGVDVDPTKLELLATGRAPIVEEGIQELAKEASSSGRLSLSSDARDAIGNSELSFVCVGTPSQSNGSQDQRAILNVASQIGAALKEVDHFHCVVIRSTVEPGTVEGPIRRTLEESSGKKANVDFGLCFQPEFLREGTSIRDYDDPPFTVIGTSCSRSVRMLKELFGHLPGEFIVTKTSNAELLKYACNCFHAVKITFANEIGRISQAFGADAREIMEMVCKDTNLNISPAYLKPGFAFGGSCLPKDLRALMYMAKSRDVATPMLSNVLGSNRAHLDHAIEVILEAGVRQVGMMGLSFKTGTDDLRESPLVTMAERLIGKGIDLTIYDPHVKLSLLIGANKNYIETHIPHIGRLLTQHFDEVLASPVVVIGAWFPEAVEALYATASQGQLVLDLVGKVDVSRIAGRYKGVSW